MLQVHTQPNQKTRKMFDDVQLDLVLEAYGKGLQRACAQNSKRGETGQKKTNAAVLALRDRYATR